ncbi:general odorant-binding protein 70 [Halyomorpha halys]|uniref:Odorant-binding protein 1 n=1 Tax=Halyomorpha halys TaxID=286706 RepID=A0A1L2JGS4_HALHY|nr:general odorant-binding protein 70 [Halyomorpha halys]AOV87018.1 odorant-binding protein 1 [Halyomorpha halys]KAE8573849.1 Odorant-binding protein 1 [Halyomorpha halys]
MQLIILASVLALAATAKTQAKQQICVAPTTAPHKIEKVLSQCQDEIKYALLQEALSVLGQSVERQKRETFSGEERRIAGCLLQCVYRKMKAVDDNGFPTAPALVQLFTEGVKDRNYYLATIQGVQQCLAKEIQQRKSNQSLAEAEGYTCDVAYDMFMCVSEQIESLCGISP